MLAKHGIQWQADPPPAATSLASAIEPTQLGTTEKIQLFRQLFRGRDDVYPVRWENQSGKTGYSPVCANEWRRGFCQKPRIKCGDCTNALYVPLTEFTVDQHLRGKITAGIYRTMGYQVQIQG